MARKTPESATNGKTRVASGLVANERPLPPERLLAIHRIMVRSRAMEERMIKMSKSGEGYFWIGGPGEEAFNACLGLQVKKGQGPDYDYLHLKYRNNATLIAMGMPQVEGIRQIAMTATDQFSLGRNFPSHFSRKAWNIVPVTSVIGIQFVMAPGTALVQKRHGGDGISIVVSGDAGTQEGDFASCLIWTSRPGNELPVLMIVMNNGWGISTSCSTQHGEKNICDRGKAFGIPGAVVDGNDPEASWFAIEKAMAYCRQERRPYLLEARVSRLYGHSSSSGALRVPGEPCCLDLIEPKLLERGILTRNELEQIRAEAREEADQAADQVMKESRPQPEDVEKFTYAPSEVDAVYPGDYTGLPS